ncbi:augmin complex subunit dgt3 isoform X2 [Toxorhynchites rutilus septentrionalis]|uniref:augmin complex subunit dgt3 isoform X2 n=1 Tax=Toxorhynchites rutilus septentrionalis TaxID=329112 RepID=UPI0024797B50|nr:augmin complex subunit dgt3 isoform X2 [Toxorhynchites rutilus septentrionalis]
MSEQRKNLEILERISGVDVGRLWLLHDESFREFFDWFGQSVDDDNLIPDSVLREYADLESNGLVLSDETLQAELEIINKRYPGILEYKDADIEDYEGQLQQLVAIEEQYGKLISDAKKTEIALTREISDVETKIMNAEINHDRAVADCKEKANFLQQIQTHTQQQIFDMHQCYVQTQNPPLFIHQMPIEQFNMKCDQFLKYLEMYIRKHFPVRDLNDSDQEPDQDHRDVIIKLESIKARLDLSEMQLIGTRKEYHGLQKMLERFQDPSWQPMKIAAMKKVCAELKASNEQDRLLIDVLNQELEMYIRQLNEQRIEFILYKNSQIKLDRAVHRLEFIRKLAAIISSTLMNAEMLWILMQLDLEKINNKFDNCDEMNSETQRCMRRIEQMKFVARNNAGEQAYEEFVAQFCELVGALNLNHSSGSRSMSLKSCILDFADNKKRIFKNLQSVVSGKFYKKSDELLDELNKNEKLLQKYVYDGPVNRPQFFDQQNLERIQRLSFEIDQIEKELKALKTDYQHNINEPKMYLEETYCVSET